MRAEDVMSLDTQRSNRDRRHHDRRALRRRRPGTLSDPVAHTQWATEFFAGEAEPIGECEVRVDVPRMGGRAKMRIDVSPEAGVIDLYLARQHEPYGPPLPVRVLRNRDGADVLFTLARFPGMPDDVWRDGVESMERELAALKRRHEQDARGSD